MLSIAYPMGIQLIITVSTSSRLSIKKYNNIEIGNRHKTLKNNKIRARPWTQSKFKVLNVNLISS